MHITPLFWITKILLQSVKDVFRRNKNVNTYTPINVIYNPIETHFDIWNIFIATDDLNFFILDLISFCILVDRWEAEGSQEPERVGLRGQVRQLHLGSHRGTGRTIGVPYNGNLFSSRQKIKCGEKGNYVKNHEAKNRIFFVIYGKAFSNLFLEGLQVLWKINGARNTIIMFMVKKSKHWKE